MKKNNLCFTEGASMVVLGEAPIQNSIVQKMFSQIMQSKQKTTSSSVQSDVKSITETRKPKA